MRRRALGLGLLAALAWGCPGGRGDGAPAPPAVRWGGDVCDLCQMIVSEERFAAAHVTAAGEERRFDDIGDMAIYQAERPQEEVAASWVKDYETLAWVPAERATLVRSKDLFTPMGSGLAAFAERARAEAFAAANAGKLLGWAEVLADAVPAGPPVPPGASAAPPSTQTPAPAGAEER